MEGGRQQRPAPQDALLGPQLPELRVHRRALRVAFEQREQPDDSQFDRERRRGLDREG